MTYFNNLGQGRIGWRSPGGGVTPSTLWTSVYAVYNADAVGSSSLKTSLFAAYNGESNANDSFGSNNGTAVGGLTYTTGKIGDAFQFNGTTSYVELPNSSGQFNFTGDFSVSAWINTPSYTNARMIFSNYVPGGTYGYGIMIYHTSTNVFSFELRNGNTIGQYLTSAGITTNSWNHITFVRKVGQAAKIYLNGVLISGYYSLGNSSIAPSFPGTQIVNIGSHSNGSALGNYKQDATTIWQKELTQSEITELYNSGNGAQYITDSFYKPTTSDALNTNNGTAQGGLTYGVGKVGTAFVGNGSNAYVSLPNNSLNFTGDFSYSFWMYVTATPTTQTRYLGSSYYSSGTYGYGWALGFLPFGSKYRFQLFNGDSNPNSTFESTTTLLDNNQWTHITVVRTRSVSTKIYKNGVDVTSLFSYSAGNATINQGYNSTQYCTILALQDNPSSVFGYANGRMDAVNFFQKSLTQSEITELYNAGAGKQYPN